jgi:hypothetical protein
VKSIFLLAALAVTPLTAICADLTPVKDARLATVLGLSEEISPTPPASGLPLFVRVYAAPDVVGECDGKVASCPDVRLFITVSSGDLGETPALYELPAAKGWVFRGWDKLDASNGQAKVGFTVQTALPESNIDASARKAWQPKACRVLVSQAAASCSCK